MEVTPPDRSLVLVLSRRAAHGALFEDFEGMRFALGQWERDAP